MSAWGSWKGAWRGSLAGLAVGLGPAAAAIGSLLVLPYDSLTAQLGRWLGLASPVFLPHLAVAILAVALGTLVGLLVYAARRAVQPVVGTVSLAVYLVLFLVLSRFGIVGDPFYAPLAIALAAGSAVVVKERRLEQEQAGVAHFCAPNLDPVVLETLALQGEALIEPVRQTVTVVVVDVHGYTGLSSKLEPEEALSVLTDFLAGCTRIVFEHGGAVDRYVGDSVTAFWNAPVHVEKHADMALEAALAICRGGAAPLNKHGLKVGVGICSGGAVVGAVGEGPRRGYTVVGEAVSVAAQLCALAPAGVILIAEPTMRLLTLPPHAQQIQPLRIKGFETPLTAYAARPPPPQPQAASS